MRQIDYIMGTRRLKGGITHAHKKRVRLSDHWPLVMKVTVKPSGLNLTEKRKALAGWMLEGDCERDVFQKEGTQH